MSPAFAAVPDTEFVERAVPLLKEYAEKLATLTHQATEIAASSRRDNSHTAVKVLIPPPDNKIARDELTRRWKYLKAPAEELARQASAVVEEGRVNSFEKVQLWLRLAEYEHYLLTAQEAVARLAALK